MSRTDANLILIFEILLMGMFLLMNASDSLLNSRGDLYYSVHFSNPISQFIIPFLDSFSDKTLIIIERFSWWFHIIGILGFLNYVLISKHLHIFSHFLVLIINLNPLGQFSNLESVTNEVKLMMNPNSDPYSNVIDSNPPESFGAKDANDLNWVQLLIYSCTECGRCTSNCPK